MMTHLTPFRCFSNWPVRAEADHLLQVGVDGEGDEREEGGQEEQAGHGIVGPTDLFVRKLVCEEAWKRQNNIFWISKALHIECTILSFT